MEKKEFREKILDSELSREELAAIFDQVPNRPGSRKRGFLNTLFKGYVEGYAKPNIYRLFVEAILILACITGIILLTYTGRIDGVVSIVLLAFLLGFVLGKMR